MTTDKPATWPSGGGAGQVADLAEGVGVVRGRRGLWPCGLLMQWRAGVPVRWGMCHRFNGAAAGCGAMACHQILRVLLSQEHDTPIDAQWERVEDLLPGMPGHVGRAANNRLFRLARALLRLACNPPSPFALESLGFAALAQDADNERAMIDSTIVRAQQHSAGAKKPRLSGPRAQPGRLEHQNPRQRGCPGNRRSFHRSAGQAPDLEGADALLPQVRGHTVMPTRGMTRASGSLSRCRPLARRW